VAGVQSGFVGDRYRRKAPLVIFGLVCRSWTTWTCPERMRVERVCARVLTPQLGTSSAGVRAWEADGAGLSCACVGSYTEAGVSVADGLMSRNASRRCEDFSAQ
jgi:hypothetical protein